MTIKLEDVQFNGSGELQQLCEIIRGRLHSANRIAVGESEFVAEIAEMFVRIGRVFADADDDLFAEFGTGHAPRTLTPDERRTRLIDLLIP